VPPTSNRSFFGIYELQLLPLRRQLTPCLSGLVLGLLPGLDDTAAELYKPVLALLDRFCSATSLPAFYWRHVWKSLLISAHVRVAAINFLLERLPRDNSPAKLAPYLPQCNTLVLNALGKALADPNGLVQRQALELLNSHFPLRNSPFDARARTRSSASRCPCCVAARSRSRAASRRGCSAARPTTSTISCASVARRSSTPCAPRSPSIRRVSHSPTPPPAAAAKQMTDAACHPLRILMFLLDTPEIGDVVIDELMVDALLYLNRYKEGHAFSHDVMRSMNLLIDQLQPEMLWQFACKLFATSGTVASRARRAARRLAARHSAERRAL
jgi:hypothetical protein